MDDGGPLLHESRRVSRQGPRHLLALEMGADLDDPAAVLGRDYPWSGLGNGQVKDILSTIISDWDTPGNKVVTTIAKQSTRQQIIDETWAQLKDHLTLAGNGAIKDCDRVDAAFIDPAIKFDSDNVTWWTTRRLCSSTPRTPGSTGPRADEDPELLRRLRLRADRDRPRVHGGRKRGRAARRECRVARGGLAGAAVCHPEARGTAASSAASRTSTSWSTKRSEPAAVAVPARRDLLEPHTDIRPGSGPPENDAHRAARPERCGVLMLGTVLYRLLGLNDLPCARALTRHSASPGVRARSLVLRWRRRPHGRPTAGRSRCRVRSCSARATPAAR